jgi:hypothetical protein
VRGKREGRRWGSGVNMVERKSKRKNHEHKQLLPVEQLIRRKEAFIGSLECDVIATATKRVVRGA